MKNLDLKLKKNIRNKEEGIMRTGELSAMLINIKNLQSHIDSSSGAAVAVELRMRLIGELCEKVRDELKKIVKEEPKGKYKKSDKYWDCKLEFLDQAIDHVFYKKLNSTQQKTLLKFRPLRNKLLHANFIKLMILLDIAPTGRHILSGNGKRNILNQPDVKEAILSIERNGGFKNFLNLANKVIGILEELILSLVSN